MSKSQTYGGRTAKRDSTPMPAPHKEHFALSHAQQRLWMMHKLYPDSLFYNISLVYNFKGKLNTDLFYKSLQVLLARHDILRANFVETDGKPVQVIRENVPSCLSIVDLSMYEPGARNRLADELLKEELSKPFDLADDLLVRPTLIRLDEDLYTFVLVVHHIVTDMWSMDIFCRDLSTLYNAYTKDETPSLPPLPIQYTDYAEWQQSDAYLRRQTEHEKYWRKVLNRPLPLVDLPFDNPKLAETTYNGSIERITISKRAFRKFRALCKDHKTTLFIGLLTAFKVFLHRITGQTDLAVGTFFVNRHRPELENLIGLLFNDLPIISDLQGNLSFTALLKDIHSAAVDTWTHSDYAIDSLIEELHDQKATGRTPIYNATFQLYHRNERRLHLEGVEAHQRRVFQGTKFDLMFYGSASADSLDIWFNYNTDLFKPETIQGMLHHFNTLLRNIATKPEARISELDLLSSEEQHQLLYTFNDTLYPYPNDKTIHELFEAQALKMPESIAVVRDPGAGPYEEWSYHTLNQEANQLAWFLRDKGVTRGSTVGVLLDRIPEMVVADLAILKAGGPCLLLDVNYPKARIDYMLQNAGAGFVITTRDIARPCSFGTVKEIMIDGDAETINRQESENLPNYSHPNDTAFIVYTSGSTGDPKGVMLGHRGVINQVFHRINSLGISNQDILCLSLSVAFSTLPMQLLTPFFAGCRMILYAQETVTDSLALFTGIDRDGVSLLEITVSSLNSYLQYIQLNENQKLELRGLRTLLTAGEKLTPAIANRFYKQYKHVTLATTFGQSECTGIIANATVPDEPTRKRIVEGRPSMNNKVYVLDAYLKPVPIGVRGTVYFSGDSVAKGYVNNPTATRRVFVPNPFSPGELMVNTGDMARRLPDGQLEVLGRTDLMVKIRGNRVELTEIENALRACQGVTDCVVTAREDSKGDKHLVACYTTEEKVETGTLRQCLKSMLPNYMIPNNFVKIDKIPLNPNNKVDRQSLPDLENLTLASVDYETPKGEIEKVLVDIWQEVLQIPEVGRRDNFFELGGHSLRAMEMVALIHSTLGVEVPLKEIFVHPILNELAITVNDLMTND